jgi:hypothetical protein
MEMSQEPAMSLTRVVIAVAVLIASVAPAMAQGARKLDISFEGGKVTLVAENVTLREILAEWARKGGSRIVNAERLAGSPVYLTEFKGQPEAGPGPVARGAATASRCGCARERIVHRRMVLIS